ncbi:MAG: UbiX family flavin prenyltransferase [Bacteroidota bacterium]
MQSKSKHKVVVGITGASGSIYTKVLLDKLQTLSEQIEDVGVVISDNAKKIWKYELGNTDYEKIPYKIYDKNDFSAPFTSGSAQYNIMIICPCSMGAFGRIASGVSGDLLTRAADVVLKERRRLILVLRETPYNLIHINNMKIITEAGGIICPATPSFYSRPENIEQLAATVVDRILDLSGFEQDTFRWGKE